MASQDSAEQILQRVNQENKQRRELARQNAKFIPGKEPFDLDELKKYWQYPYANKLSAADLAVEMQEIEDQYYLVGAQFLTMESFGKHLMEMEFYR